MPEAKKPEQKKPKPKKTIQFFFRNNAFATKMVRKTIMDGGEKRVVSAMIRARDNVAIIAPNDPFYDDKVSFMRKHPENEANGGIGFVELTSKNTREVLDGATGKCIIDELLEVPKKGLIAMVVNKPKSIDRMTKGALMMLIMKEKGLLA
jgi:hypothetical protein